MPLYLSTLSLMAPTDLAEVLDLFKMAEVKRLAPVSGQGVSRDSLRMLLEGGFELMVHHDFPPTDAPHGLNPAAGDEDFRTRSVKRMETSLAYCADRGVASYSFMPGYALQETLEVGRPSPDVARDKALDQLKRSLDRLASTADRLGVALALTNSAGTHPSMIGSEASELLAVIRDLQIPFLGIQADLGHLWLASRSLKFEPEAFVEAVRGQVRSLRLSESDRSGARHRLPAEGGFVEEMLAVQPDWHALPMALDVRGTTLDRLLATVERLEAKRLPRELGPALPPGR